MSNPESQRFEAFKDDATKARYMAAYDALLAKWPVPFEELFVPTGLGVTHVVVSGPQDAPPLVLLHAFLATATVWRPNVEGLSRHFRVYAVDIIGQVGKSVSNRPIKNRRTYANWMCELFDALGIARASLVGSSYGAFLALSQASLAPERVDRVVMINPGGVFASFILFVLRMMLFALILKLFESLHLRAKGPTLSVASVLGRNVQLSPDDTAWADLVSLLWPKGMRPNAFPPTTFSAAELRAIRTPALLLMGDNDLLYDPRVVLKRARKRMPSLEAHMIPNAHHIAAMARPDEVNARIIQFLQRAS